LPVDAPQWPHQATITMERLAGKVERTSAVSVETARELAELTRNPRYDCRQMRCTAELAARNEKARERLLGAVAQGRPADVLTAAAPRR
jgi:hypothetical protein